MLVQRELISERSTRTRPVHVLYWVLLLEVQTQRSRAARRIDSVWLVLPLPVRPPSKSTNRQRAAASMCGCGLLLLGIVLADGVSMDPSTLVARPNLAPEGEWESRGEEKKMGEKERQSPRDARSPHRSKERLGEFTLKDVVVAQQLVDALVLIIIGMHASHILVLLFVISEQQPIALH